MSQKEKRKKLWRKKWKLAAVLVLATAVLVLVAAVFWNGRAEKKETEPQVISISTLEKIIDVSELSTFTAVYNGIAEVPNEENPDQIDYYVSYEAKINAGIDFREINISETENEEGKVIRMELPEVYITEINVDIGSLDFIFLNNKANTSTVSGEAFKACEEDVRRECEQQESIYSFAKQNAENVLTALVSPLIEQLDGACTLEIR